MGRGVRWCGPGGGAGGGLVSPRRRAQFGMNAPPARALLTTSSASTPPNLQTHLEPDAKDDGRGLKGLAQLGEGRLLALPGQGGPHAQVAPAGGGGRGGGRQGGPPHGRGEGGPGGRTVRMWGGWEWAEGERAAGRQAGGGGCGGGGRRRRRFGLSGPVGRRARDRGRGPTSHRHPHQALLRLMKGAAAAGPAPSVSSAVRARAPQQGALAPPPARRVCGCLADAGGSARGRTCHAGRRGPAPPIRYALHRRQCGRESASHWSAGRADRGGGRASARPCLRPPQKGEPAAPRPDFLTPSTKKNAPARRRRRPAGRPAGQGKGGHVCVWLVCVCVWRSSRVKQRALERGACKRARRNGKV